MKKRSKEQLESEMFAIILGHLMSQTKQWLVHKVIEQISKNSMLKQTTIHRCYDCAEPIDKVHAKYKRWRARVKKQ